jgi:hypothetical protein
LRFFLPDVRPSLAYREPRACAESFADACPDIRLANRAGKVYDLDAGRG